MVRQVGIDRTSGQFIVISAGKVLLAGIPFIMVKSWIGEGEKIVVQGRLQGQSKEGASLSQLAAQTTTV